MKNIFNNRRFKYGSLATIITVGFIVVLVLVNVVATLLLERYPLTIDLTSNSRFSLTDQSLEYIKNLDQDVEITVLNEESTYEDNGEFYKQAYEIIRDYARNSSHIKVNFVSLTKDPTFASKYPGENLATDDIIVKTDKRYRIVKTSSLFTYTSTESGGYTYSSQAEQQMTSAIMYVTDANPAKVTLLTGLDNTDVSGYVSLLKSNNYEVVETNLLTEEIDPESAFVILPHPSSDLSVAEVKKLETYLDNDSEFNKNLIFFASQANEVGPVLKNFLADWGIEIGSGAVWETQTSNVYGAQLQMYNYMMGLDIVDSDTLATMSNTRLPLIGVTLRPIYTLFDAKDNRSTTVIAQTKDTTVLVPAEEEARQNFDVETAEKSSFNAVVKASKSRTLNNTARSSNIIVCGSADMAYTQVLQNGSYLNSDFFVSTANTYANRESGVKIIPVDMTAQVITITESQIQIFSILFMAVIPIGIVIAGVAVWLRRRHL